MTLKHCLPTLLLLSFTATVTAAGLSADVEQRIDAVMPDVVTWRRDFHQNPELSNQEFRTAAIVAEHLRALGMEVHTELHTPVLWGFSEEATDPSSRLELIWTLSQ